MTSFMTQEDIIKAINKLKKKTKKNETSLKDIYPKLLTFQSEMFQADKRNQETLHKVNEVLTILNINKDKPNEETWQKQIDDCTAELHSCKEEMSKQREILQQLDMKYFTEINVIKEKVDQQNNILKDQEKESNSKLHELQREISEKLIFLQQEQVKTFNEINDMKSKSGDHKEIFEQHISDNRYKLDTIERQISSEFVEWKEEQRKQINTINVLKSLASNFNETLKKNSENQMKFDYALVEILKKLNELEEGLKHFQSQTNNQTGIFQQQQIQIQNEILYIKTQIFKVINEMDVKEEMTPLHMACEFGLKDIDNKIIYKKNSLKAVNKEGMTPLHLACKYGLNDVAIIFINRGAHVNAVNIEGMTPLHFVCKNDLYEISKPLTLGCYSLKYKKDKTNFHFAFKDGKDLSILLNLLKNGADINCKTKEGWTPLHFASHSGYDIMVRELLKHGANIHSKTNKGCSAIHLAALQGYFISEIKVFTLTDINCKNRYEDNALYLTASEGHISVVRELLSHGADVGCQNDSEWRPLHVASLVGNVSAVKELLNHETDINCKNKKDETPLHIASHYGHVTVVTELLNHGASINCRNTKDDTPLNLAAKNGLVAILTKLLEHEADITCKNKQNKTALDLAKEMKRTEAVNILIAYQTIMEKKCSIL